VEPSVDAVLRQIRVFEWTAPLSQLVAVRVIAARRFRHRLRRQVAVQVVFTGGPAGTLPVLGPQSWALIAELSRQDRELMA
jgi:hypothetical protein